MGMANLVAQWAKDEGKLPLLVNTSPTDMMAEPK